MKNFATDHIAPRAAWLPLTLGTFFSTFLGACSSFGPQDGPPGRTISAADIQDAVPKSEPLSKYGNPSSYVVAGRRYYVLDSASGYVQRGTASWYGTKFHGQRTSSGEMYDMYTMSAAHRSLPLPTYVQVTNLENNKRAIVKVNDRGPFYGNRLIDLSYAAAVKLGIAANGTAQVEVRAIDPPTSAGLSTTTAEHSPTAAAQTPKPQPAVSQQDQQLDHGGHFVQVGAFADRGNAERLQKKISLEIPYPVSISNGGTDQPFYRVRVGPFRSHQQAEATETQLSNLGINDTLISSD